jgi:4-hydroxybenzoate polyprenyltransferase
MKELIQLSRWQEHIPFTIPLTILGAIVAASNGALLDIKLLYVIIANVAAMSYAFMINDIEDAPDDLMDPKKAKRNPVSAGRISRENAYTAVRLLALVAVVFYALTNKMTLGVGIVTFLLSHTYSWRRIRLKAYPVTDIVSHSLMLSGLLLISGFTAFSTDLKHIWILTSAAVLFSVYGQLYNQIRDFEVDTKAKLKNTTILIGKRRAEYLKNAAILLAVIALLTSIYYRVFPVWLVFPIILTTPFMFLYKSKNDSSGTAAIDLSGEMQLQLLLLFNIIILVWIGEIFLKALSLI